MGLRLVLVTGRTLEQAAGMHKGKCSEEYRAAVSRGEIAPENLAALSLAEGGAALLRTEHGAAEVRLFSADLPAGLLFLPLGPCANALVGDETEGTGMPSFKGIPVEVEPL